MHRNLSVGAWIARRAAMNPSRVALVFEGRQTTYAELDARITRIARGLQGRGIEPGDRVAFVGRNHPAALQTLFACALMGAIYVPINPGWDDATRRRAMRLAEPRVVVVTAELLDAVLRTRDEIPPGSLFTTDVVAGVGEGLEALHREGSEEPLDRDIDPDTGCVLAFSSGTTGNNKGILLTHGNLFANAVNTLSCVDLRAGDVLLASAPLCRTGGLGFCLATLFAGGTCVVQPYPDPERSLELIREHRVTTMFDGVDALQAMLDTETFGRSDLSSLRLCLTGGSFVPPALVDAYAREGLMLQPGYGLTEASPLVLVVPPGEVQTRRGASGRPALLCRVRVVDQELEDVAPGVLGELLVAGPNITPGYWRNPEATAESRADGWLRTGDVVRADEDGMISVFGRLRDVLVLGGQRIHPAAAEDELRRGSGLREVAIVQWAPETVPAVVVVPQLGERVDRAKLSRVCAAHLGDGTRFEVHTADALPRNANGKILRHRLRGRYAPQNTGSVDSTVPSTLPSTGAPETRRRQRPRAAASRT